MADDINNTLDEREATHGDFSRVADISQQIKSALSPANCAYRMTAVQCEAIDMIASKLARIVCGNPNERDHWHDIAGYATLVERSIPVPPSPLDRPKCYSLHRSAQSDAENDCGTCEWEVMCHAAFLKRAEG